MLISRISHTPLPLPANLPHAPKILKKVEKLSTIENVVSSTEHTQSMQSGNRGSNIQTKFIVINTIKSVHCNDNNDDDNINNENDNENCQNKNDDGNGENSNAEDTITFEKSSVENSYDEITEMTLENTDLNGENKEEKEYSESSDMEVDLDIDLGYDSGDNRNDEIENAQLCSMSNDYDDDNHNDGTDLINFEANYTVTSRLWGNRNGQNFPVENGINNSQITDVKDVSNLTEKNSAQTDNENRDVTDEESRINDTGASVIRFRKTPLNSMLSPVEPVGEKRAGIPRCGSKYQADIEPFEPSSSLIQPLDNVRTHTHTHI